MNKVQMQMKKAKKAGMSPLDVQYMREIARKEAQKMEQEATEKAFLYMLSIPLIILFEDYWKKTAKKKAPKFIEDVASLYESVQMGVVTEQQLADSLYELAGIKIEAEWLERRGGNDEQCSTGH
jgi:hypothetical protein